ncbi:MAG: hypothetical protein LBQ36_09065 [Synergistaceae bacterium]|jgi:PHD/YefM family antitoxin component YafN of YafNO toxin-antitoxin module|nr:hypothetical protein [Synergistaceae bacterium]
MPDTAISAVVDERKKKGSTSLFDFCASPDEVTEQLKREGQLVITNDDRPIAVIIDVDDLTLEDTLNDLRRLKAQRIMKLAQTSAAKNGSSKMTLDEINAEIGAMRAERRVRENPR